MIDPNSGPSSPFDEVNDPARKLGQGPLIGVASRWISAQPDTRHDLAIRADVIAFSLTHIVESGWGTYYGPTMTGTRADGSVAEVPSRQSITTDVVAAWASRVEPAKHPLLRHRYADLVWDFTKLVTRKPASPDFARAAIDAAIEAVGGNVFEMDIEGYFVAERAINLSKSINDKPRQRAAEGALIEYERRHAADRHAGTWGRAFDALVLEPSLLDEQERAALVAEMEARLERLSSPNSETLDPFGAEAAAERLITLFRKRKDRENEVRVMRKLRDAFLAFCALAPPMLSDAWIDRIHVRLIGCGLNQEAESLEPLIREYGKLAAQELKPMEMSFTVPAEQVEELYRHLSTGTLEESIATLAASFLPSKEDLSSQLKDLLTHAPLMARICVKLTDDEGKQVAKLGSVESDLDGRLVHEITQRMSIEAPLLREMLRRLEAKLGLAADPVLALLKTSILVEETRYPIVEAGVQLLFDGQHLAAAHVLLPQIEHCVRILVRLNGGATTERNRYGGLDEATLDKLLSRASPVFGEDRTLYLRALLTDRRGWNLRNLTLHGLMPASAFGPATSDRILHALFMLAQVRKADANTARPVPE